MKLIFRSYKECSMRKLLNSILPHFDAANLANNWKSIQSSLKKRRTDLKIFWTELNMNSKKSLNSQKKNKSMINLQRLKFWKETMHNKLLCSKMKSINWNNWTISRVKNLNHSFWKIRISEKDMKKKLNFLESKTMSSEQECSSFKKSIDQRLRTFKSNTVTTMFKEQLTWKNNMEEKSNFFLMKSINSNG